MIEKLITSEIIEIATSSVISVCNLIFCDDDVIFLSKNKNAGDKGHDHLSGDPEERF